MNSEILITDGMIDNSMNYSHYMVFAFIIYLFKDKKFRKTLKSSKKISIYCLCHVKIFLVYSNLFFIYTYKKIIKYIGR